MKASKFTYAQSPSFFQRVTRSAKLYVAKMSRTKRSTSPDDGYHVMTRADYDSDQLVSPLDPDSTVCARIMIDFRER